MGLRNGVDECGTLFGRGFDAMVKTDPAYPGRGSMPLTLFYVTMTRPKMGRGDIEKNLST
jgi:hypothetical protein